MAQRAPVKLGVLISGTGTNLQAIIDSAGRGELRAGSASVISNRPGVQGLERARRQGIQPASSSIRRFASREGLRPRPGRSARRARRRANRMRWLYAACSRP